MCGKCWWCGVVFEDDCLWSCCEKCREKLATETQAIEDDWIIRYMMTARELLCDNELKDTKF